MPKVALLGNEGGRYDLVLGVKTYVFRAGHPKVVPAAVAIEAGKRVDEKGRPLFTVEDMPVIVKAQAKKPPENDPDPEVPDQNAPDQNAPALHLHGRQRTFESWPLEFM